jgi:hypothetical protein
VEEHQVRQGEVGTVLMVLARNRVFSHDSRRYLLQFPDKFYGSIVAHLVGEADARVVEQHITEGFQHHGLSPDPSGIARAVGDLVAAANGWERRGKAKSRAEVTAATEKLLRTTRSFSAGSQELGHRSSGILLPSSSSIPC